MQEENSFGDNDFNDNETFESIHTSPPRNEVECKVPKSSRKRLDFNQRMNGSGKVNILPKTKKVTPFYCS